MKIMNYTITEDQIKDIALGGGKTKIKEMFPEVFKANLEDNTWYIYPDGSIQFNNKNGYGYGINSFKKWVEKCQWIINKDNSTFRKATETEVQSALVEEAKNRNFKQGGIFIDRSKMSSNTDNVVIPEGEKFFYDFSFNILYLNEKEIFNRGVWAEIIEITPKQFFLDILGNELTIKIDREKYPDSVFYFKGETCLLELEKSSDKLYLWCNYSKIWNPILNKFSLDYSSIQQLIKETVEEHFKMSDVTPTLANANLMFAVEEHFKMSDVTPIRYSSHNFLKVEEHFKMSDVTPYINKQ